MWNFTTWREAYLQLSSTSPRQNTSGPVAETSGYNTRAQRPRPQKPRMTSRYTSKVQKKINNQQQQQPVIYNASKSHTNPVFG